MLLKGNYWSTASASLREGTELLTKRHPLCDPITCLAGADNQLSSRAEHAAVRCDSDLRMHDWAQEGGRKGHESGPPQKIREDTNLHAGESRKPRVTSSSLLTLLAKQRQ